MSEEIMAAEAGRPARTLAIVTEEIRYLDAQAKRLVLGHAIEIGRRLTEAKALVPYGGWGEYIEKELDYSQSTANNFMRIFDEYGAAQQSLFGPIAESQTLGKLSYTKALRLLAVPREEREEFAETVDAEHLSTRELEQAIRERDAARAALAKSQEELKETAYELDLKIRAKAEADERIKELESRPVEVAVQEPDPAVIQERAEIIAQKAIDEQAKKAKAEIDAAKKDAKDTKKAAAEEKKALEDKIQVQKEKLDELFRERAAVADAKTSAIYQEEIDRLTKQLAMSDAATTTAKVLFSAWQEAYRKLAEAVEAAPAETGDKLRAAVRAQAAAWAGEQA